MARPLFDSPYIFGIHEPGGERHMLEAGRPGWIVFTEAIGHDPNDGSGRDFRSYSNQGLGILCRLNNGYFPDGTIPNSASYEDFARRCARFVAASPGCKLWIIGNEMNFQIEQPPGLGRSFTPAVAPAPIPAPVQQNSGLGATLSWLTRWTSVLSRGFASGQTGTEPPTKDATPAAVATAARQPTPPADDPFFHSLPERFNAYYQQKTVAGASKVATTSAFTRAAVDIEKITPELYARCYKLCRDAIRALPGHADDQVLVGAIAPWNNQTSYPGNTNGDWVQYLQDILNQLGSTGCDGITLHVYTHQADPNLVTSDAKMGAPFQNRHFEFRTYQDFMGAIPTAMRQLPVYITETDENVAWLDQNIGWVQRAYAEIDWWNRQPGNQQIRCLALYRWPPIDRWVIEGKPGVIEDFRAALTNDYRWRAPSIPITLGATLITKTDVNLRRTAGYVGKPATDVLTQLPVGARLTVVSTPSQSVNNLIWWQVHTEPPQAVLTGWVAQFDGSGSPLVEITGAAVTPPPSGAFKPGDLVRTTTVVRMRRTPGFNAKPATDVIADLPVNRELTILAGPSSADNLIWWQARGQNSSGATVEGWVAEVAPTGERLLELVPLVPPPDDPPPQGRFQAGDRVIALTFARLRRSPGFIDKPATDIIADIWQGTRATIVSGPRPQDDLIWWEVDATDPAGARVRGWIAEIASNGVVILDRDTTTPPVMPGAFAIGELVVAVSNVRVRRSSGYLNKPDSDVLGEFPAKATLNLINGPQTVDGLTWWLAGGITPLGERVGWVAQRAPNGATLVARPTVLPGTTIPDRVTGRYLGLPTQEAFALTQLWGERPQVYSKITYDGVPLKGHNGVDFAAPMGANLLATDRGVVTEAVFNEPGGFGHYVKLTHSWGESIYAHLSEILVQPGQSVARAAVIGKTGATGFVDGPHLHFAIRINPYSRTDGWGGFSDPLPFLSPADLILPAYVLNLPTVRSMAPIPTRDPIANAPGILPEKPGVRRP